MPAQTGGTANGSHVEEKTGCRRQPRTKCVTHLNGGGKYHIVILVGREVATPQVSLPVPYCIPLQQVRQTCVPAQTGGTANGSLVDEKKKSLTTVSSDVSAHPTNRAVTSQPTAMHNRSTELLQAELSCQKADQPCCYKPTNRAIKSPNPNNRRCYKPTKRVVPYPY